MISVSVFSLSVFFFFILFCLFAATFIVALRVCSVCFCHIFFAINLAWLAHWPKCKMQIKLKMKTK